VTDPAALLAMLEAAAADLPDATRAADADGSTSWERAGASFAVLHGATVELKIGATIAAAAVRTQDVTASPRGPDWVAFAPADLDDHALDRLGAWFAAAHRRAVG
jgi:hypothetical protein